ncbi:MAG TPA: RHS repeat-associated core domain-containing protein [Myxococcota bacterium]|nr:RHS repeat-associated core domain-containing protein [Myxococcota bacterium]
MGHHGKRNFGLDPNGYLETIENPAGETNTFGCTNDGLMLSMRNPRGYTSTYHYDDLGRLEKDVNAAGGYTTLARETVAGGYDVRLTTAMGRDTIYGVETLSSGAVKRRNTFPSGLSNEALEYPDASRGVTFADGTLVTTAESPDPRFGMSAAFVSERTVTTPVAGHRLTQITERSVSLLDEADPLSLQAMSETNSINGRAYTKTYDAAQKLSTSESPEGRKRYTWLDAKGRVAAHQVEGLAPVSFGYDARGRLESMTDGSGPDARVYQHTYYPDGPQEGYLWTITDPLGRIVSFDYDTAGRVTGQTLPDGRVIQYGYDSNGNVTSVTPPGRPGHDFNYTPIDLQQDYTPPPVIGAGANLTHYDYNLDGQLELVTRPDGQAIDLGYDTAGRLAQIDIPRGRVELTYDAGTGQLSEIVDPDGGSLSYTWDGMLLTGTTWSGEVNGSVVREYDDDFRLSALLIDGQSTISYGYDDDGLLTQAGDMTLTRDPQNGLVSGTTLGDVTTGRTYNEFGELKSYTAGFAGAPIFEQIFERDALGRITTKTETIEGVPVVYEYIYDQAGRLHEVKKDGLTTSIYDYDSNSNRISYTDKNGATITGAYDDQDRMLAYGEATYTYTPNGELASKTVNGERTTYVYDVLGNLTNVTLPDGTEIRYIIDGRNRRVGKEINGTTVQQFIYQDQLNPIAELGGTGEVVSVFVYGTRANVPEYMISKKMDGVNWRSYRIVYDHLGSPMMVVEQNTGDVTQALHFDEFGRILADTNPGFQPFGFAGGIWDIDTELVRFGARDFNPLFGRWTIKDPVLFSGRSANLYGYSENDPVNWIDLIGLKPGDPFDSLREAAEDALENFGGEKSESCGYFYKMESGEYSYTGEPSGLDDACSYPEPPGSACGEWHSHGTASDYPAYEFFSWKDKEISDYFFNKNNDWRSVLITPSQQLREYFHRLGVDLPMFID